MAALSPRSGNIQMKPRVLKQKEAADEEAKKAEAAKKALKEKDYAPPPPEWVLQPPIANGGLAEKFKTGKCLGKGGFAICYEGELKGKNRGTETTVYALKVVKAKMNQRKMEEKFRTELQIHAKMQHPNIVEFHRAFTFKESTFVVLELCANGSVMDMVKKRRCLSLPEVRRYTVQLCGAIKYMHARNVIHRDLKMGNLFLDHNMNLKIGDFGLAAVLVSADEYQKGLYEHAKSRRTTLCGTPNYIAPEILEKGKGGHDYKVDIWAIGVIVFAMLVGQPPFQSTSQNEIYRRARSVEYAWPETGKHQNDIPEEAKDLVSQLLKVDAEERPDPDQVIGHPFFAMHGGNAIPLVMEEYFRREKPKYLDLRHLPRGDVMLEGTERLSLRTLARQCGVGQMIGDMFPQPAVGGDIDISLYGQCQVEEDSGNAPVVPMPKDMVYVSKFSSASTQVEAESDLSSTDAKSMTQDIPSSQPFPVELHRLAPIQSHAASLRASHVPSKPSKFPTGPERGPSSNGSTRLRHRTHASVRERGGLFNELPVRPTLKSTDAAGIEAKTLARNPRATRQKKIQVLDVGIPEESSEAPKPSQTATKDQYIDEYCSDPDAKRRELSARTRARIATNVQKELIDTEPNTRKTSVEITSVRTRPTSDNPKIVSTLIGPDEPMECLPNSKPDDVLQQLRKLHKELEDHLKDIGKARDHMHAQAMISKNKDITHRPVVVKWVDYTNKFGIGYILQNGTVGCVFKGDETNFPTCVVVANTESHLNKRKTQSYPDKHQLLSRQGAPVEFIENCDEDGLKRVFVSPTRYQVKVSATGVPEHLGPGSDIHDHEKRRKLALWDKFGRYMTQNLGKSDEADSQSIEDSNTSRSRRKNVAGPFLKFYQRLGNVGIWGFGDGSFQINFPDHTKLVISDGGAWLDFYHLPIAAAQSVQAGGYVEAASLADRGVLSYPTGVLLSGAYRGHHFEDIVTANQLSAKLAFAKDVVGIWSREGGLGCMGNKKGFKWEGMREQGSKLVWVTVGAKGGDSRYEQRQEGKKSGLYEMKGDGGKLVWVPVKGGDGAQDTATVKSER